jgi:hypothetical protein
LRPAGAVGFFRAAASFSAGSKKRFGKQQRGEKLSLRPPPRKISLIFLIIKHPARFKINRN